MMLREKPRYETAPYENPVRRYVRLKEKERLFSLIPPKRLVPVVKKPKKKMLQSVEGVPTVSQEALAIRLQHLLGDGAVHQQLAEPIFPFENVVTPELRVWKRQLREIRKIYRAQYLQKLAEVTEQERIKQAELFEQEDKLKAERRLEARTRFVADQKRRAVLKDRMRLDDQVEATLQLQKRTESKAKRVYFASQLEARATPMGPEGVNEVLGEGSAQREAEGLQKAVLDRNTNVHIIMERLGYGEYKESTRKKIHTRTDYFRKIAEESFKLLPEDAEPIVDAEALRSAKAGYSTARERAQARYQSFSEDEKLRLLDEKIEMIKQKLDKDSVMLGGAQDGGHWALLLEQLEAARMAHMERGAAEKGRARAKGQE